MCTDGIDVWEIDARLLKFEKNIASGSYVDLYKGTFCSQDVAIKVIRAEHLQDNIQREFAQEVYIMRKIRHKNIVQFIGACIRSPSLCIVTEFMSGGSVYDFLHKQKGAFRLSSVLRIAIDISKGMNYLHQNNIVHRDLKAANLLMDENEVVKIADFGVARVQAQSGVMTAETGSYRWMAPEVIEHKPYDHKADIFTFGIVLWEILTGKLPYEDLTPIQAVVGVVREGLRPTIPSHTHPEFIELLERCWQQDPALRPVFSEIVEILQHLYKKVEYNPNPFHITKSTVYSKLVVHVREVLYICYDICIRNFERRKASVFPMSWREVAVRIDDGKRHEEDRSKKHKVSFEDVLAKAVERGMFQCDSNLSWRSLVKKTKSRLIDPPEAEEHDLESERELRSEDDVEDNQEESNSGIPNISTMFQWASLVLLLAALFCTLVLPVMKKQILWDLLLWKWEILILALICGRLVSGWLIRIAVILIEHNFLLRKRVLYFVYGLRKAVQNFVWLSMVLLVWHCLFGGNKEAKSSILPYVSKVLVCLLVATFIWLLKILLVKVLASSFHVNTFFDRIQDNLFNQYVIETFSLPPMFANRNTQEAEVSVSDDSRSSGLRECLLPTQEEMRIDHLHTNISAWNMRKMMNIIRHGSLSTLDEKILNSDESSVRIRSEWQATEAAKRIFHNVAKAGSDYIYMDDVMQFMSEGEALKTMHHLGATTKHERISQASFRNWVVNVFKERRALGLSLNDTKTSVDELHKILDILISIIITIISLVILGIPITHFLVFISSQLLLVVFIFGNTCRTVFEAIIFLFVMHPFDVGDSCQLDGEQMIVEEMNILTTVFMTTDGQKIMYPNSVLATKSIVNHYRSPEMLEAIDFKISVGTPMEKIERMKERLRECVKRNGEHWHPDAMVVVREIDDMGRIKVSLWAKHRINQQNGMERWIRRSRLVEEMIMVMKDLHIELAFFPTLPNLNG